MAAKRLDERERDPSRASAEHGEAYWQMVTEPVLAAIS